AHLVARRIEEPQVRVQVVDELARPVAGGGRVQVEGLASVGGEGVDVGRVVRGAYVAEGDVGVAEGLGGIQRAVALLVEDGVAGGDQAVVDAADAAGADPDVVGAGGRRHEVADDQVQVIGPGGPGRDHGAGRIQQLQGDGLGQPDRDGGVVEVRRAQVGLPV